MDRITSFAKIAGFCFLTIMLYDILIPFLGPIPNSIIIGTTLSFILNALWVIFFILLISASVKRSPVITPSWIAIFAFVLVFIRTCFLNYSYSLYKADTKNWSTISTINTVSSILYYVFVITLVIAFIWLSKYFQKKSFLKSMCIVIAVAPVVILLSNIFIHPWKIDNESTRNNIQIGLSLFESLTSFIPEILFFFAFSKLKK